MKPLVIITRPEGDAESAARDVVALGFETHLQPLMQIVVRAWQPPSWASVAALIITSGNAVPGLVGVPRDKPVFVVGTRTAEKLKTVGFADLRVGAEISRDLPPLIMKAVKPEEGTLLHLTSPYVRDAFHETLVAHGYQLQTQFVYDALPVPEFSAATVVQIQAPGDKAVLFYSPRSVVLFQEMMQQAGLVPSGHLHAFCLSPAVAAACDIMFWQSVHSAETPTHAALLTCLAKWDARGHHKSP